MTKMFNILSILFLNFIDNIENYVEEHYILKKLKFFQYYFNTFWTNSPSSRVHKV